MLMTSDVTHSERMYGYLPLCMPGLLQLWLRTHVVQLKLQLHRPSARVAYLFVFTYVQEPHLQKVNCLLNHCTHRSNGGILPLDQYIVALSPVGIGYAYQTSCCNQW